jgi:predicted nucleotidyltransferase
MPPSNGRRKSDGAGAGPRRGHLTRVAGVVGVTLGGSRARGDADAASDVDLGVYYRDGLDLAAVRRLAADLDPAATVSGRGGWGPWVDGGAWLVVDGTPGDRRQGRRPR